MGLLTAVVTASKILSALPVGVALAVLKPLGRGNIKSSFHLDLWLKPETSYLEVAELPFLLFVILSYHLPW